MNPADERYKQKILEEERELILHSAYCKVKFLPHNYQVRLQKNRLSGMI